MAEKIHPLDMKKTIEFYEYHRFEVPKIPEQGASLDKFLSFAFFPDNAKERSILKKVTFAPSLWFHKDSTKEKPMPTPNRGEAISKTAIIPSYISYDEWAKTGIPSAEIFMYEIPKDAANEKAIRIIQTEGLIHEIAHSLIQPAFFLGEDYVLRFRGKNRDINGKQLREEFQKMAEKYLPISHYSSFYRGADNKFEGNEARIKTAISEELAESVAACSLGFAYCEDECRALDPFRTRPDVEDFVYDFVNAELVREGRE